MKRFNDFLNEEAKDTTFQRLAKFQKRFEIIVDDPPEGEEENEYQENEKYQLIFDLVDDFFSTFFYYACLKNCKCFQISKLKAFIC